MPDRPSLDLVIKNVRLVRPRHASVEARDLGVVDGRFARVEPVIDASEAHEIYDARGRLGFPGVVDAHTHVGIYAPLGDDAVSESKAAVSGGTTTVLTYFRTGQYYLNQGGPYAAFFPQVLAVSRDRYWCDYAYHLAPIQSGHIGEMEWLAAEQGVPSFKIFMFYGGHGLHGQADRAAQRRFLMVGDDESYDFAHFEFIMREAARIRRVRPDLAPHVTVSLHCEVADILDAYTRRVAREGTLTGLRAYSAARRPTRRGSRCGSRVISRTRPSARASTCSTSPPARRWRPRWRCRGSSRTWTYVVKSPSGTCCSTATLPPVSWPRSTRPSARGRTWSSCGRPS